LITIPLIGMALTWFVAYYMEEFNVWAITAVTTICLAVIVVNLVNPNAILYDEVYSLHTSTLPWLGDVMLADGSLSLWHFLIDASIIIVAIYFLQAILRLIRLRKKRLAITWGILLLLIILTAGFDYAVVSSYINSFFILEFSLLLFVVIMSPQLISDMINSTKIKKSTLKNERSFKTLTNNIDLIVVGLNRMGNVDYINPYFLDLTGYEADEVIGKDWFDTFLPKNESFKVQSAFLEILKNDFHPYYTNSVRLKTGVEIMVIWYNVRLLEPDGRISGSLSIGIDVSSHAANERLLREAIEKMESLKSNNSVK